MSDDVANGPNLLRMRGITKRFGATLALDSVDFDLRAGEVHALLGENGAGKSTLMHVLGGLTFPDSGEITVGDRTAPRLTAREARTLGIGMVHQHFALVPAFTVADNLALDAPRETLKGRWSARDAARPALERARDLGWEMDANAMVSDLSVGAQQRVEIVKALATNARIVVFDEPTAVLSSDEVDDLFDVLRRLAADGAGVILIAHKLREILAVADRVTVLRRGRRIETAIVARVDARMLAAWMIGSDIRPGAETPERAGSKAPEAGPSTLEAIGISVKGDRNETAIQNLSMTLTGGGIFGVGGVDGNGQTELAEALVGLRRLVGGRISWNGGAFRPGVSPTIGYVPQDRRRAGLAVTMSIEDNLTYDSVDRREFRVGPFLRRRALRRLAGDLIEQFDVRTPSPVLPASALSGGNQQKTVVARALHNDPALIVAVNPTRGLDIGATRFVHDQLRAARERGAAIALISTDLDEVTALADRTAILSAGTLTEFVSSNVDRTEIGLLLGGIGAEPER